MAGQGRRLRCARHRGRVRHRAARLAHECHRAAGVGAARRPAGAGGAAALPAPWVRQHALTMDRAQQIADGLARVRERIARAEQDAGRPAGSVRLIAVSKKMPADDIRAALAAGQRAFGENYAQELRDKLAMLADDRALRTSATLPAQPEWHFIGPLQTNKLKYVAGRVAL